MSVTAQELRKLAALNLAPEQMAGVLDLLACRVEAEDNRRAAQAERKRRSRDNRVTVTGQECDKAEQKGFDKEIPHTPLEINSKNIKTTTRVKALVPENWFPSAKLVKLAHSLGFTEPEIQDQFERMRDWSHGNNEARSDWDAAFRNWLKRAADDRKAKNANTRKPNTIADGFDLIDRAIEDQERRLAQAEEWPRCSEDDPVSIPRLRQSAA
jgi:hypothetical protein